MERGSIHFRTYSPTLNRHAGRDGESSFDQAPTFSDFTLPMPVQVSDARGEHAHEWPLN